MFRTLPWAFLVFISASSVFGADLEVSSRVSNLFWSPTKANNVAGYTYDGSDLFWNLQGSITQEVGEGLLFMGGLENDPVLRQRVYGQLAFSLDNLTISFTPFIGTFSSAQKWFNPGMEAQVEYTWPGVLFLRGGFLTSFAPVSKVGDYYLASLTAASGAQLENGIVTFLIEDKSATFRTKETLTIVDTSTKYWLDTEMFLKNFPLRWAVLMGYQKTGRSYVTNAEVTTSLHSFLLGARFAWDFGMGTQIFAQAESSLFNVGWDSTVMKLPSTAAVFQTVTGVRYHW